MTALAWPAQFDRLNRAPLETNTIFLTLSAATTYASTGASYPGQEVKVITTNPDDPIVTYEVQRDRTLKLKESGGNVSLDEQVIVTVDIPGSGLQVGDIIVRWGETEITNPLHLIHLVTLTKPGTKETVEVFRNGEILSFEITVGTRPTVL